MPKRNFPQFTYDLPHVMSATHWEKHKWNYILPVLAVFFVVFVWWLIDVL